MRAATLSGRLGRAGLGFSQQRGGRRHSSGISPFAHTVRRNVPKCSIRSGLGEPFRVGYHASAGPWYRTRSKRLANGAPSRTVRLNTRITQRASKARSRRPKPGQKNVWITEERHDRSMDRRRLHDRADRIRHVHELSPVPGACRGIERTDRRARLFVARLTGWRRRRANPPAKRPTADPRMGCGGARRTHAALLCRPACMETRRSARLPSPTPPCNHTAAHCRSRRST